MVSAKRIIVQDTKPRRRPQVNSIVSDIKPALERRSADTYIALHTKGFEELYRRQKALDAIKGPPVATPEAGMRTYDILRRHVQACIDAGYFRRAEDDSDDAGGRPH